MFWRKQQQTHCGKEPELMLLLEIMHCMRNLQISQLSTSSWLNCRLHWFTKLAIMIIIIIVVIEDYTRKVYLATFSDSNTWDFCLVMTRISKKIRAKTFWTLPNIARNQDVLTTFDHFKCYFKGNKFSVTCRAWNEQ